ncbi:MAG TPA: hypothetical protein PK252_06900 [Bacteroidales bacterium]|nr:hypothetical protein [Bacteroidales bacterium]
MIDEDKLFPDIPEFPDNYVEKGMNESKLTDFKFTPPPPPPPPADNE